MNLRTAYECAICSQIAYHQPGEALDLLRVAGAVWVDAFDLKGTQGVIAEFDDYTVVAFRGTTYEDIIGNLHIKRVPGPAGAVHAGFLNYTGQALNHVSDMLRQRDPGKPVIFTGHSLGGAAATLAAAIMIVERRITNRILCVVTFGSPRVGNHCFTSLVDQIVDHRRFVNANDGVAYIPWMLGTYQHCGTLHYITIGKKIWRDPNPIAVLLNRWGGFRGSFLKWATNKIHDHSIRKYIEALAINLDEVPR